MTGVQTCALPISKRFESYIIENLERISRDKQYLDSFIFMLNNSKATDRSGHELKEEGPLFSAESLEKTLKTFTGQMQKKKALERNITAKKHIKAILYSKDEIVLSLYYKTSFEGEEFLSPTSGRVGAAAGRIPEFWKKISPWGTPGGYEVVSRLGLEPSTHALKGRCSTG